MFSRVVESQHPLSIRPSTRLLLVQTRPSLQVPEIKLVYPFNQHLVRVLAIQAHHPRHPPLLLLLLLLPHIIILQTLEYKLQLAHHFVFFVFIHEVVGSFGFLGAEGQSSVEVVIAWHQQRVLLFVVALDHGEFEGLVEHHHAVGFFGGGVHVAD